MKLVHIGLEKQIRFEDKNVCEWVIESPELFAGYINELYDQFSGGTGKFVLSEDIEEINLSKAAEIVIDPFNIDVNNNRILKRLYSELSQLAYNENFYMMTNDLFAVLDKYCLDLEQGSPYMLKAEDKTDITAIFKSIGLKLEDISENIAERLSYYIKIMAELMEKRLMIFVNIRSYINADEFEQLIAAAQHNDIGILFIENMQRGFSKNCDWYIIDKDGCEIY